MARKKQLSKEKRVAIITLRNEGQSVRKIGKTLKVSPKCSRKNHQALQRNWLTWGPPPGKEDQESPLLRRIKFIRVTSLRNRRLTAAQIRDQVNATQSSSSRHISRTTVKRRLCESGLHGRIAARKPLLRTGNKQKRLVWAKEHKEWTLDQWKSVLWSDESKFEIFGSNHRVFVRRRKRWTDGLYMPGSHREAWRRRCDGVGVLCWWHCWGFIQNWRHTEPAWLPQHLAAACYSIRFAFSWTSIYFSTGQWPQTHLQAV